MESWPLMRRTLQVARHGRLCDAPIAAQPIADRVRLGGPAWSAPGPAKVADALLDFFATVDAA